MEEMEDAEDGKMNEMSGSPLVRSLRARLERAEEQVKRARDREKALRERLEGDDISHLLAAQRSQAELLRKENQELKHKIEQLNSGKSIDFETSSNRDQIKEAHKVAEEAQDKYRQFLKELGECQEKLMEKEKENAKLQANLTEANKTVDSMKESMNELEQKVQDLTRQLEDASNDLELAAVGPQCFDTEIFLIPFCQESDIKKQREIENLNQEIEMQQMDILALQRQLAESATEDAGASNAGPSGSINHLRCLEFSTDCSAKSRDRKYAQEHDVLDQLQKDLDDSANLSRSRQKKISDLEMQLEDAGVMWRAAVADGQALRAKLNEAEQLASKVKAM
eukprot:758328-Hanusia_phi.AAC.2